MKQNILVIRLGSLGDIVLTSAALVNLKIKYPRSHLTFLCKEKYAEVVGCMGTVDEIRAVPDNVGLPAYVRLLMQLDKRNYNFVIDLHGNARSWMAREAVTADRTVRYPKRRLERILAVKGRSLPVSWPHTIDLYNEAVIEAGGAAFCRRPIMSVPGVVDGEKLESPQLSRHDYVVVAPGAAHENKRWPIERFVETAVELHRHRGVSIVWMVTGSDREKESPRARIPTRNFYEAVDCSFAEVLRILSGAALTIANDSGIAHASSAVGVPVIAIFGPTHPTLGFAPRGMYDRVMQVDEYCRPCSLHGKKPCYRDKRHCFERISAEMVVAEASEIHHRRLGEAKAVFVDRDGTIIRDKNFLSDPDDIEFETGSVEGLRILEQAGFKLVIVSNQSGVARGFFGAETVDRVNGRLLEMLAAGHVDIASVQYCPHHPMGSVNRYAIKCECRKPGAAMAEDAAHQLGINIRKSYVIGDKLDDVNFGRVVGAQPIMVKTGYGITQAADLEGPAFYRGVPVVANLLEAARMIVSRK
ncbi:MAG: HAD-IIIA family hydrolase [Candidatus Zixiibacteriota bacterium]